MYLLFFHVNLEKNNPLEGSDEDGVRSKLRGMGFSYDEIQSAFLKYGKYSNIIIFSFVRVRISHPLYFLILREA